MRAMDPQFFFPVARAELPRPPSSISISAALGYAGSHVRHNCRNSRRQLMGVIKTIAGAHKLEPGVHQMFCNITAYHSCH